MASIFEKALENDTLYLKEHLAEINQIDERGKSVLHYAVLGSSFESVEFLLAANLSPNIKDANGETPIYDCARKAKLKIAKLLINKGANINVENKKEEMPIHLACHKGDLDFIKLLVESGSILNKKTNEGRLPIHYAILGGNYRCLDYLVLMSKEDYSQKDFQGNTLLHYGARTTNHDLVDFLLKKGLNPNSLNDQFETPLFNAARYGNNDTINLLLNKGALINIKNRRYETPLDTAQIYNQDSNYNYLSERLNSVEYEKYEKSQLLTLAVLNRDHIELRKLIDNLTKMNKDSIGKTALDYAKEYRLETCITMLKDYLNKD